MATPRKEHPYQDTPQVTTIKGTLEGYGYQKLEARYLAREIAQNLNNYLSIQEAMVNQRLLYNRMQPTQTKLREA